MGRVNSDRQCQFSDAIYEGLYQSLAHDACVSLIGLGVTDPKGIFGTTLGLEEAFGEKRVMDMPTSENAMTGIVIGASLTGARPILNHQRIDFALLSLDQIINNAAKWHYTFNGQMKVPIVIRMIIGMGWGQGSQHSQSLQSIFAHIPGLKVVMPSNAYDAKGMLTAAVQDDNPVIFLEHRWLHHMQDYVPKEYYCCDLDHAKLLKKGADLTIISSSFWTTESLLAAKYLEKDGISVSILDLRSVMPLDKVAIIDASKQTGRVLIVDGAYPHCSVASEIMALLSESLWGRLKCAPRRLTFPACPTPTSHALANHYYPRYWKIANSVRKMLGYDEKPLNAYDIDEHTKLDIPNKEFTGPF